MEVYVNSKELFNKACDCDVSIVNDPDVDKIVEDVGFSPLHLLAEQCIVKNVDIKPLLKHPSIGRLFCSNGHTPLRMMTYQSSKITEDSIIMIMQHPDAIFPDEKGWTVLHDMANFSSISLLHPMARTLKDNDGNTPYDVWNKITR